MKNKEGQVAEKTTALEKAALAAEKAKNDERAAALAIKKSEMAKETTQETKKILGSEREASRYLAGEKSEVAGKLLPNRRESEEGIRS